MARPEKKGPQIKWKFAGKGKAICENLRINL